MTPLARVLGGLLTAALLVAAFVFAWVAVAVLVALIVAFALTAWILRVLRGDPPPPPRGPAIIEGEFREEPEDPERLADRDRDRR